MPSRYHFLPLAVVEAFVPVMARRGVSEVARSPRGFLTAYRKAGSEARLDDFWLRRREGFIARHMAQVRARREPLYESNGQASRRHLALIAWAYSPEALLRRSNGRRLPVPTSGKALDRLLHAIFVISTDPEDAAAKRLVDKYTGLDGYYDSRYGEYDIQGLTADLNIAKLFDRRFQGGE
jgi:hypothetical protein